MTESALMQNSNKAVVMMIDTLRHEGSKVYIDDFGTGFSNLSYLKNLPVDAVKIDQTFVRRAAIAVKVISSASPVAANQCRALLEQMGEMRRFTETLKVRALLSTSPQDSAPVA